MARHAYGAEYDTLHHYLRLENVHQVWYTH